MHFDVISQAQGSVLLELGATKVLCGMCVSTPVLFTAASSPATALTPHSPFTSRSYGPREGGRSEGYSDEGRLRCDVKYATFARKHARGAFGQGPEERELSAALAQALSGAVLLGTFPKSVVDVYALVLDAHGSELAAAVMAASLALGHAGVAARDLVCACGAACVPSGGAQEDPLGTLLLDPSPAEVAAATGAALVAAMPVNDGVTLMQCTGHWPADGADEAVEACLEACRSLDAGLRAALREETQRTVSARAKAAAAAAQQQQATT